MNKKAIILIILSICAVEVSKESLRAENADLAKEMTQAVRISKRTAFEEWKECPFIPKKRALENKTMITFALDGILWDEENPSAIINNEVVRVGDKLGGNRIVAIKPNRVILNNGAEDFEVRLEK